MVFLLQYSLDKTYNLDLFKLKIHDALWKAVGQFGGENVDVVFKSNLDEVESGITTELTEKLIVTVKKDLEIEIYSEDSIREFFNKELVPNDNTYTKITKKTNTYIDTLIKEIKFFKGCSFKQIL